MNDKTRVSPLLKPHGLSTAKSQKAPLLDIVAAAYHLGCSERFVRRLVQERRIPFVKLGGTKVRFVENDLDHWISNQRIEAKR